MMLTYPFLLMFLFVGSSMANRIAGKWQLLFYYQAYRYQVDAFGLSNTEMAVGCSKATPPVVCNLKDFVDFTIKTTRKPKLGADKKPERGPDNSIIFITDPDIDKVDWDSIGDGDTLDMDKFGSEMDRVNFKGLMINDKTFKAQKLDSFSDAMNEAVRLVEKAKALFTSKGLPTDIARWKAMDKALEYHGNARRADQAILLMTEFDKWAGTSGVTPRLGETISRPGAPTYQKLDAQATISENGLTGKKAQTVKDYVIKYNTSGKDSIKHMNVISMTNTLRGKLATACGKK